MANRKKLFDHIAITLQIKLPRDWGKITNQKVKELGGGSVLGRFNDSLFGCLQSLYQGTFFHSNNQMRRGLET